MATANQRAITILEALLNGPSTAAQRQKLLDAYGSAEGYLRAVGLMTRNDVKKQQKLAASEATEAAIDAEFAEQP